MVSGDSMVSGQDKKLLDLMALVRDALLSKGDTSSDNDATINE